ncbi:MAG: aspartate-semialdehyde dehydrogenase [Deltaproteobacteria bacterium]|nr:aspartate-semialdehyde dehydrogenase [Deltaproteobacteria bacterium]
MQRRRYTVAVLGATGAVGREMLKVLDERRFPVEKLVLLASARSVGEKVTFGKREVVVQLAEPDAFEGVDIVLASAGSGVSKQLLPEAVKRGAVCIDNSSAYRMDDNVPLVVPEVNPEAALGHKGIIANPNCSTIQMVVALKPLHDEAKIRRVVVTTYQSVSGAGQKGIEELAEQTVSLLNQKPFDVKVHAARIAFNVVPQIGTFGDNGYTDEEMKLVNETRKILGDPSIAVCPTAVRVPVFAGHSESVVIETERPLSPERARELLAAVPGMVVVDDPHAKKYPMPIDCAEQDEVLVGRVRRDFSVENGLAFWVVADNLRKGAATNAVQIAQVLDAHWNAAQA